MPVRPLRIGLIVPSSNTVMEPDFHRHIGAEIVSTTRIFLEDVTRDAEIRMMREDLPKAAELIRTTAPDLVVFGCTSAGALGTLAHDFRIGQPSHKATGATGVTVLGAVLTQLRAIGPRKVAVFTPYVEDLANAIASSLAEAGYPPLTAEGMRIRANLEIGAVPPSGSWVSWNLGLNDVLRTVLLQIARSEGATACMLGGSYAAMPKIVWMNWRCATASPFGTQRT